MNEKKVKNKERGLGVKGKIIMQIDQIPPDHLEIWFLWRSENGLFRHIRRLNKAEIGLPSNDSFRPCPPFKESFWLEGMCMTILQDKLDGGLHEPKCFVHFHWP